jgi:hypothetical protein
MVSVQGVEKPLCRSAKNGTIFRGVATVAVQGSNRLH